MVREDFQEEATRLPDGFGYVVWKKEQSQGERKGLGPEPLERWTRLHLGWGQLWEEEVWGGGRVRFEMPVRAPWNRSL